MAINVDWNTNIQTNEPLQQGKSKVRPQEIISFLSPYWPGPSAAPIVSVPLSSAQPDWSNVNCKKGDVGKCRVQNANCKTMIS